MPNRLHPADVAVAVKSPELVSSCPKAVNRTRPSAPVVLFDTVPSTTIPPVDSRPNPAAATVGKPGNAVNAPPFLPNAGSPMPTLR